MLTPILLSEIPHPISARSAAEGAPQPSPETAPVVLDETDTEDESAMPCETCKVPGAPAHEQSFRCQYRSYVRAHCTCSACF